MSRVMGVLQKAEMLQIMTSKSVPLILRGYRWKCISCRFEPYYPLQL